MSERYDGREIVGLDLHRHRTVMVRMTPTDRRCSAEAGDVTEFGGEHCGQDRPDPVDALDHAIARVAAELLTDEPIEPVDLGLERGEQPELGIHPGAERLGSGSWRSRREPETPNRSLTAMRTPHLASTALGTVPSGRLRALGSPRRRAARPGHGAHPADPPRPGWGAARPGRPTRGRPNLRPRPPRPVPRTGRRPRGLRPAYTRPKTLGRR